MLGLKSMHPIKIVNRLITPVICDKSNILVNVLMEDNPKQPEIALENPSAANDPCNSSISISLPSAPVQMAVVAPVVSAADTRNTIAIVKNAPISKTGLRLVKNTSFGILTTPTCAIVFEIPGEINQWCNSCNGKDHRKKVS